MATNPKYELWNYPVDNVMVYGVWNTDMQAKQYVAEWGDVVAPDKATVELKVIELNSNQNGNNGDK